MLIIIYYFFLNVKCYRGVILIIEYFGIMYGCECLLMIFSW